MQICLKFENLLISLKSELLTTYIAKREGTHGPNFLGIYRGSS